MLKPLFHILVSVYETLPTYSTEEHNQLPVGREHRPEHAPRYLQLIVHLQIDVAVPVSGLQSIPSARRQLDAGLEIDRMQMCIGRKSQLEPSCFRHYRNKFAKTPPVLGGVKYDAIIRGAFFGTARAALPYIDPLDKVPLEV
uniref:Uncharacterized protein n=1 Tax=Anopheles coluzzii TaxID=1518534 RepID=A0A8W7PNU6_ANOCL